MADIAPPTSQRAGERPIAFVIQNGDDFLPPVTLSIRPTDLTKTEPARQTVQQTLGRDGVLGWVDDWGAGIPSVSISGHTGWRVKSGSGKDGVQSFKELNDLISVQYHALKQNAINIGIDPADIKLIFVDMLDDFVWSVTPIAFALQRSKSQPLLMKYNINLQALDTEVENPLEFKKFPQGENVDGGLNALQRAIKKLKDFSDKVKGWAADAISKVNGAFSTVAGLVKDFHDLSTAVFETVNTLVNTGKDLVGAVANNLIGIASDIAAVGTNLHRTLASILSLPSYLKAALSNVANAFLEVKCIFSNSLRPRDSYEDFNDLNGASNCSSTSGGGAPSRFSNGNAFNSMTPKLSPIGVGGGANSSINTMSRCDPVLAPIPINEMGRHLKVISDGVTIHNVEAIA